VTPDQRHGTPDNETARVRLGAGTETQAEVLIGLTSDPSVTVRAALALNTAAPAPVNDALANDHDERVRILLARKLAALAPGLSAAEHAQLYQETWAALKVLASDVAVRVRAVIAEAVKELPDAPHELIRCLAHDADVSVSEPVIRLSPMLTAEDLIALVVMAPSTGTALAVARRAGLEPAVSDAIAATTDNAAIRALLNNPSAQIREVTLDALVARSVDHPEWHEPLVRRPSLPWRAARMLSEIMATHLLAQLASRADVAPPLAEELHRRIADRLATSMPDPRAPRDATTDEAAEKAKALVMRGELTEETLLGAARRGEERYAAALLALAAGTTIAVVDRASLLRSAKGIISLVWKAGLSMRVAVALQTLLARLSPNAVLSAGPADRFPLTPEEMRWQLDFLMRMGR
jgi:uncharacterized protein (DUF2336 family)